MSSKENSVVPEEISKGEVCTVLTGFELEAIVSRFGVYGSYINERSKLSPNLKSS